MKAVNVDDVLKIIHKYGKYLYVTDAQQFFSMIDEISNLKALDNKSSVDKIPMLYDIYMMGVNMTGDYQGCWVRFKNIEEIVNKYID